MKWHQILLAISLLLLTQQALLSQKSRFGGGLIAGVNFSELEGNRITDYYGINAGVFGTVTLAEHIQIGLEFLFSQNGEYVLPAFYPRVAYGNVWLNHLEIPVYIDWLWEVFKRKKSHHLNFNLGLAYIRLLSYSAENIDRVDITEQIVYSDQNAFLLQLGMRYHFTPRIGLNVKTSLPLEPEGLGVTLATRIVYTIR